VSLNNIFDYHALLVKKMGCYANIWCYKEGTI